MIRRRGSGAALAVALFIVPTFALAETKQECAASYVAGQVARKDGRLREARTKFAVCASAVCPAALQKDCKPWGAQLDKDVPTLAVAVIDDAGADVSGAAITVDASALPPTGALALDPGEHVVRVEASGMKPTEERVTLAVGERRQLTVRVSPTTPAIAKAAPARGAPVATIVLASIGVVGLGVFAGLGTAGNSKVASLDALACKPHCPEADVSAAKSLYLGADVALGIGLASIAGAVVTLIVHLASSPPPPAPATVGFSRVLTVPGGGGLAFRF